jgi:hypothetical protein
MPRTSKALAVLDEREAALQKDYATLKASIAGIEMALEMVQDMRKRMAALPKRTRSKKVVAAPPASTATAA